MTTLQETLLAADRRPRVVEALVQLADSEMAAKKGITGTMMKTAYQGVRRTSESTIRKGADRGLPLLAETLEPYWATYRAAPNGDFGAFLANRSSEVADALLTQADRHADRLEGPLAKAFSSFRGKAKEHVVAALPGLGRLVQRFAS